MKIKRDKYLKSFTINSFPQYICPICGEGHLVVDKDSFKSESTKTSDCDYEATGEVGFIELRFIGLLRCNNHKCKEVITVSGMGSVEEDVGYGKDGERFLDYVEFYEIKWMCPIIDFFEIDENCPDGIQMVIRESFSLFWIDPSSAGNKIRKALDCIMDSVNVDATGVNAKGDAFILSLHKRIEKFGVIGDGKYSKLSNLLLGLKWLGNAGSHREVLSKEDILDAYDVLSCLLDEIYVREKRVAEAEKKADKLKQKYKIK